MAPQEKKWDDSAERDLCVAIIQGNQDTTKGRHNWPRIAEIMSSLGYSFTKDAMSQHFTKTILKEFRTRYTPSNTTEPPTAGAMKPKATRKASTSSKKRTKKGAKGQLPDMGDDEDDDFDLEAAPSKKLKKEDKGVTFKKEEAALQSAAADNDDAFRAWAAEDSSTVESQSLC